MPILLYFLLICGALYIANVYINCLRYERMRKELGCPSLKRYPSWDRMLGVDYVYAMVKALKENRFLEFQKQTYRAHGRNVWTANFLGNRMIYSSRSENLKAISTSHAKDFAVEPIRVGNGAITPFTGRGVSLLDGEKWQTSRDLIRPYFDRAAFSNVERLRIHVDRLISKIPRDGSVVDMQPLFQRWFLDTSTEFLFRETVNSLDNPDMDWLYKTMVEVMAGLRLRLQMSSFLFLHRDKSWFNACKKIHEFLDGYIKNTYKQLQDKRDGKLGTYAGGRPRDDFLWTLAKQVLDYIELCTQLTSVWIPLNETTSILMSNTFFALARHPQIVATLRREILDYGDSPVTFEGLRSLKYLRWVINESHRLYPISLQTVRCCMKDTTLLTGGGENGELPVFCAKGNIVHCNRYLMHRDPEIWGDDAETFRPERWKTLRPMWNFVPFGGGPRICPAHVMVDIECSYTIFRIFQHFKSVQAQDNEPYTAVMRVGPSNKHGCKVAFGPLE